MGRVGIGQRIHGRDDRIGHLGGRSVGWELGDGAGDEAEIFLTVAADYAESVDTVARFTWKGVTAFDSAFTRTDTAGIALLSGRARLLFATLFVVRASWHIFAYAGSVTDLAVGTGTIYAAFRSTFTFTDAVAPPAVSQSQTQGKSYQN